MQRQFIIISLSENVWIYLDYNSFYSEPTHRRQHLYIYIISDAELVNSAGVSDFVSDHCVLHASLVCTRSHPKQKQITFRPLKTIDHDLLSTDIGKINFNLYSKNVDSIVGNYNTVLLHYWINMLH